MLLGGMVGRRRGSKALSLSPCKWSNGRDSEAHHHSLKDGIGGGGPWNSIYFRFPPLRKDVPSWLKLTPRCFLARASVEVSQKNRSPRLVSIELSQGTVILRSVVHPDIESEPTRRSFFFLSPQRGSLQGGSEQLSA